MYVQGDLNVSGVMIAGSGLYATPNQHLAFFTNGAKQVTVNHIGGVGISGVLTVASVFPVNPDTGITLGYARGINDLTPVTIVGQTTIRAYNVGQCLVLAGNVTDDNVQLEFKKFDETTRHGYIRGVTGTLQIYGVSTLAMTVTGANVAIAGTLTMSLDNIILGSNYLSGDGGDEGVSVSSTGAVTCSSTLTVTGALTVGTVGTAVTHTAYGLALIQAQNTTAYQVLTVQGTSNAGAQGIVLKMYAVSGKYNWLIANQQNVNNGLEITPSTAVDGTTFTTPVFSITQAGAATITGTLTIGGALAGVTTLALSDDVTFSASLFDISANTSDGTDNKRLRLNGGGSTSYDRGGYIAIAGNEDVLTGKVIFQAGDVVGGTIDCYVGAGLLALTIARDQAATFGSTLTTSAPVGGAGAWELGIANAVSPTSPNRTITIEIGGTAYYIHCKTTND